MVIYRHITLKTHKIFYIGIGNKRRPYSTKNRNKHWKNTVAKHGYYVEILKKDLIWEDACELEMILIAYHGRKDLGTGILVNMTDGGDGVVGWSDEMREKCRVANLGIPKSIAHKEKVRIARLGFTHTEDTITKMKLDRKGNCGKKVIDTVTGIIYPSAEVASHLITMSGKSLCRCLKGDRKNNTNFKYLKDYEDRRDNQ